ncbi:MAG TPA: hypothetical protein VLH59_15750 [Ignavibacteriaceae bacterium]|nr:hypothetical protein [Ignavibacteriaceae bacterium]
MKCLAICSLLLLLLICCTDEYNLSVEVSGRGTYEITPQKNNYEEGETVTITATPDSGWLFNKWLGSINTNYNPLSVRMDGDKYLELVFSIPYKPSMNGDWDGIQYDVEFHIQQALFDSSLTGTHVLHLSGGTHFTYSVTGYNIVSLIVMNCKANGAADVQYLGTWSTQSKIFGGVVENGIYYKCDLQRAGDSPLPKMRQPFIPKKIAEL